MEMMSWELECQKLRRSSLDELLARRFTSAGVFVIKKAFQEDVKLRCSTSNLRKYKNSEIKSKYTQILCDTK